MTRKKEANPMPATILFVDHRSDKLDLEREVTGPDAVLLNPQKLRFDEIEKSALRTCDAVITSRVPVDAAVIEQLERARIIVRNGVGFDIVDLEACGAAGIAVCNVPDYGTTDVADMAIALMLTFARGTAALDAALRADLKGGWTYAHNVTARRLRGACFGVIGFGRIGTASALRAQAFGSLAELLGMADVVTIHAPLTAETNGMIDAGAVAAMKPGMVLINTARGPICDTGALLEGLRSGQLTAVGLDVLPREPATADDPLVAAWRANEPWIRGRVLLSPHAGFYSPDSFVDLRRKAIETAWHYLRDGKLANCVNAEYLKRPR